MSTNLATYLDERRQLIERRLAEYLSCVNGPAELLEAMRYCLLAPGKRLRPLLVLMAAEAAGGRWQNALPAACALEMVHTYSLVHDDLPAMDNDDLRRGQPTCHKKFSEATAILVGDALLTLAFHVLSEDVKPADLAVRCCQELSQAAGAVGMVGGQIEDLRWERQDGACADDLETVHRLKTGALFRAAVRMGGLIGGYNEENGGLTKDSTPESPVLAALDDYAQCLGLAFQISDDLLDAEGQAEQAGKRVHKDAERGKLTYPALLGVAESRRRLQNVCKDAQNYLAPLGAAGRHLTALAALIMDRDR